MAESSAPSAVPAAAAILDEIRRLLREEVGLAREVGPADDLLVDLQLDSVALLTLVVALEDRFRVALAEEDAARVRTAGELAELISQRAREAAC